MITRFEALSPAARIEDAVALLLATTQREFPVVDGAGHLRGVLTRDAMILALKQQGPETPVLDAMRREIPLVQTRQCLADAIEALQSSGAPAVGVVDPAGRLAGLVTPETLGELMMVHGARAAAG